MKWTATVVSLLFLMEERWPFTLSKGAASLFDVDCVTLRLCAADEVDNRGRLAIRSEDTTPASLPRVSTSSPAHKRSVTQSTSERLAAR